MLQHTKEYMKQVKKCDCEPQARDVIIYTSDKIK